MTRNPETWWTRDQAVLVLAFACDLPVRIALNLKGIRPDEEVDINLIKGHQRDASAPARYDQQKGAVSFA